MFRAARPTGVNERVVEILLNLVDHLLFEVHGVMRKQPNTRDSFFDHRFMAVPDGSGEISAE